MPQDEWRGEYQFPPVGVYQGPTCPGYLARMPQAREAEVACSAHRAGELAVFFPDGEATILAAALELDAALRRYEAEQIDQMKNR